jgi:twitching motility protein PilT
LHVVSIEDPIELTCDTGLGLVEQREVGKHVPTFAAGIEWAQRQGADVIMVADLEAKGCLEACLQAARARCLVLAGLRASSCASALSKLMSAPDVVDHEALRFELAYGLRLALSQRLMPRARGAGRIAVFEQVINTSQVTQVIREDKLQQLHAVMAAGKTAGMSTLDDALDELVRTGAIALDSARLLARRSERFAAP